MGKAAVSLMTMAPSRVGPASEGSNIPDSALGPSCIEETTRSHPLAAAEAKARTALGAELEFAPEEEVSKPC